MTAPISIKLTGNNNPTKGKKSPNDDDKKASFWSWYADKEAEEDALNSPASPSPTAPTVPAKLSPMAMPSPVPPVKDATHRSFKPIASAASPASSTTPFSPSNSSSDSLPHLETFHLRSRQIFVSKIPIGLTQVHIATHFAAFGLIQNVEMNIEESMSEAYVTFAKQDSVKQVLSKGPDGHSIDFFGQGSYSLLFCVLAFASFQYI